MKLKAWTLKQLYTEMLEDLQQCQTRFEKINCISICMNEIKEKANSFSKKRRLTPVEKSILYKANNYSIDDF